MHELQADHRHCDHDLDHGVVHLPVCNDGLMIVQLISFQIGVMTIG